VSATRRLPYPSLATVDGAPPALSLLLLNRGRLADHLSDFVRLQRLMVQVIGFGHHEQEGRPLPISTDRRTLGICCSSGWGWTGRGTDRSVRLRRASKPL